LKVFISTWREGCLVEVILVSCWLEKGETSIRDWHAESDISNKLIEEEEEDEDERGWV
jgi:hypothetical protein